LDTSNRKKNRTLNLIYGKEVKMIDKLENLAAFAHKKWIAASSGYETDYWQGYERGVEDALELVRDSKPPAPEDSGEETTSANEDSLT
jgi:hypothetical protein